MSSGFQDLSRMIGLRQLTEEEMAAIMDLSGWDWDYQSTYPGGSSSDRIGTTHWWDHGTHRSNNITVDWTKEGF